MHNEQDLKSTPEYRSGMFRIVQVVLMAMAIALGTAAAWRLTAGIYGQTVSSTVSWPALAQAAAVFIGCSGFCILFNVHGRGMLLDDVADAVCRKMISRHPHVFGDGEALPWEELKRREKGQRSTAQAMEEVAHSLPGLWRAEKIQAKAAGTGFDWPDISGAMDKLDEEVQELHEAVESGEGVEEELGDVLFAAVKAARFAGVDPEAAIAATCEKFIRRFRAVEEGAAAQGRAVSDLSGQEMLALYDASKRS